MMRPRKVNVFFYQRPLGGHFRDKWNKSIEAWRAVISWWLCVSMVLSTAFNGFKCLSFHFLDLHSKGLDEILKPLPWQLLSSGLQRRDSQLEIRKSWFWVLMLFKTIEIMTWKKNDTLAFKNFWNVSWQRAIGYLFHITNLFLPRDIH